MIEVGFLGNQSKPSWCRYSLPGQNQHNNCWVLLAPGGSDVSPPEMLSVWASGLLRTTKICGASNQSSVLLFLSSARRQIRSLIACRSLWFSPLLTSFHCEIAFLLLQTAASVLMREEARSILPVQWRRGEQSLQCERHHVFYCTYNHFVQIH